MSDARVKSFEQVLSGASAAGELPANELKLLRDMYELNADEKYRLRPKPEAIEDVKSGRIIIVVE